MSIGMWITIGVIVVIGLAGIRIIRPTKRGLVETLGKYSRFASPGFHWIIPIIQNMYIVDITENMVDAQQQEIITSDNLNATVDAQVYFKVKDDEASIKNSQYKVRNYKRQIVSIARTTLRHIIGNMSLKECNSQRDKINKDLMEVLKKETKNWGIDVVRTELKEISPPKDVQETMNKVVKAENEKEAAKDFALAKETEADGDKKARIKKAEGEAEAIEIKAKAEATAIKEVHEAANKYFTGNAQKLKQLEVTEVSLKDNAKVILTEKGIKPQLLIGELPVGGEK